MLILARPMRLEAATHTGRIEEPRLSHRLQVLVLLQQGGGTTLAATVNAHTGEVLTHTTLQLDACQVLF